MLSVLKEILIGLTNRLPGLLTKGCLFAVHHGITEVLEFGDSVEKSHGQALEPPRMMDSFAQRHDPVCRDIGEVAEFGIRKLDLFGIGDSPDAFAENLLDAGHTEDGFVVLEQFGAGQLGDVSVGHSEIGLTGRLDLRDRFGEAVEGVGGMVSVDHRWDGWGEGSLYIGVVRG